MPWFVQKHLPRTAMQGMLPDAVRNRPKAMFPHMKEDLPSTDQVHAWSHILDKSPEISRWINIAEYCQPTLRLAHMDPTTADSESRPASLAWWLWCNNCGRMSQ
jgi:hypothetical protein